MNWIQPSFYVIFIYFLLNTILVMCWFFYLLADCRCWFLKIGDGFLQRQRLLRLRRRCCRHNGTERDTKQQLISFMITFNTLMQVKWSENDYATHWSEQWRVDEQRKLNHWAAQGAAAQKDYLITGKSGINYLLGNSHPKSDLISITDCLYASTYTIFLCSVTSGVRHPIPSKHRDSIADTDTLIINADAQSHS